MRCDGSIFVFEERSLEVWRSLARMGRVVQNPRIGSVPPDRGGERGVKHWFVGGVSVGGSECRVGWGIGPLMVEEQMLVEENIAIESFPKAHVVTQAILARLVHVAAIGDLTRSPLDPA
jgi:hypothetical protein